MRENLNFNNLARTKNLVEKIKFNNTAISNDQKEISKKLKQQISGLDSGNKAPYYSLISVEKFLRIVHQNRMSVLSTNHNLGGFAAK